MKRITVFIILFFSPSLNKALSLEKSETHSISKANTTEQNTRTWNIKLDIYFSKSLPPIINKTVGTDVRLKCEATMNFTKVEKYTKGKGVETLSKESPPDHIQQRLMKNVKVYWLKNSQIVSDNNKIKTSTKIDMTNGTIGSNLRIKDIDSSDEGNYTCVLKQNYEKYQTTLLKVLKDDDTTHKYVKPTDTPFFNSKELEMTVKTTPDLISEDMKSHDEDVTSPNSTSVQRLEPICQEYTGIVCAAHLKAQFVYIPYDTSQAAIEDKLMTAIRVTQYSNDISSQCEGYALPSLCYSTFPICRDPISTNKNFFEEAKRLLHVYSQSSQASDADHITSETSYENVLPGFIPNLFSKFKNNETLGILNYRYNSTILRRVCKQDCEILENELCQTEYAIAKRHPHIGRQLTLEDCQDLPEDDPACLQIGIGPVMVSDDECYWENGSGYLGKVNVANNGMACIEWSKQMHVRVPAYPELTGLHSYCRNPGGIESQPWCIVEKDGKTEKQLCDIRKCAHSKNSYRINLSPYFI